MICSLNSASAMVAPQTKTRPLKRITTTTLMVMFNTSSNTQQLRTQIDELHIEAEKTRAKARSARLRLMRLSEAAEKLQKQAATDVQLEKENEARELLVQKKKVMQALEKSKNRIELLDELLAKINEAISMKETHLIGTVASGLEVSEEDASTTVHVVSPKDGTLDYSSKYQDTELASVKFAEDHELQFQEKGEEANFPVKCQEEDIEERAMNVGIWSGDDLVGSLNGISSFENFLEHIDQQLGKIELELVRVLRVSTLILESEERPKNSKVQQTLEILENLRGIRVRIASIMKMKAEVK